MKQFCRPKCTKLACKKDTYTEVEFARVDSVVVAVECLHTDISSDIPHANSLVTWSTHENLTERHKLDAINTINVAA